MSGFWTYFRETLAWPLLAGGALAVLVRGAALVLDQARQDILWLREQFNPETCDAAFLAEFGASRGLTRHPIEDGIRWRARVVAAYAWQMLGGTAAGLPVILEHYGFIRASVHNLRSEDPARWAEFRVLLESEVSVDEPGYELLLWVINDQKRASSLLAQFDISISASGLLHHATTLLSGEVVEVLPWSSSEVETASALYTALGWQSVETVSVFPQ